MKRLLAVLAALVVLAGLGWGSGILYWHLRIRSALRTVDQTLHGGPLTGEERSRIEGAVEILLAAGCRTLPHLMDSLDASQDRALLRWKTYFIAWQSVHPGLPLADSTSPTLDRRRDEWVISFSGQDPAEVPIKLDRIRRWWKEHGSEHHQFWRWWTNACRPRVPEEQ
jgi:hypothetical protein